MNVAFQLLVVGKWIIFCHHYVLFQRSWFLSREFQLPLLSYIITAITVCISVNASINIINNHFRPGKLNVSGIIICIILFQKPLVFEIMTVYIMMKFPFSAKFAGIMSVIGIVYFPLIGCIIYICD